MTGAWQQALDAGVRSAVQVFGRDAGREQAIAWWSGYAGDQAVADVDAVLVRLNGHLRPDHLPQRGPRDKPQWWVFTRDGEIDTGTTAYNLPASDMDLAACVTERFPRWLYSVPGRGSGWHIWSGTHLQPDSAGEADKLMLICAAELSMVIGQCIEQEKQAAERLPSEDRKRALDRVTQRYKGPLAYAAKLRGNAGATSAAAYLAKACAVSPAELEERHPDWLNTPAGTYDLRTLAVKAHDPRDRLTYCTPVAPLAGPCPLFYGVVWHLAGYDCDVAAFLMHMAGYALRGDNPNRWMVFLHGPTASGKTVFLDVLRGLLGPLATDSGNDLICYTPHGRNARVEHSIINRRLVTVAESSEHRRIDESQVKRLTGESRIAVNQHYAIDTFEVPRTWLIVLPTNELPSLGRPDSAIRDRIAVVRCGQPVPPEKRVEGLAAKIIEQEGPAVLWALMHAARASYASGSALPLAIRASSDAWLGDSDQLALFIRETMVMQPGSWIERGEAWKAYEQWAGRNIEYKTRNQFYRAMREQPGITVREYASGSGHSRFEGVAWSATANLPESWRI